MRRCHFMATLSNNTMDVFFLNDGVQLWRMASSSVEQDNRQGNTLVDSCKLLFWSWPKSSG